MKIPIISNLMNIDKCGPSRLLTIWAVRLQECNRDLPPDNLLKIYDHSLSMLKTLLARRHCVCLEG